jgi:exosome complex exonuclease DIS3/RRP44
MYHRITRRGKLLRVHREHYLRDDVGCGLNGCADCVGSVPPPVFLSHEPWNRTILVIDTNIVLHQMDVLEAAPGLFSDVVVPQTVAQETRHRNLALFGRLSALLRDASGSRRFVCFANEHHRDTHVARIDGESPNDHNDRAVRVAALWYQQHLAPLGLQVLLLTDDAANAKLAAAAGLPCSSMADFAAKYVDKHAGLLDIVAAAADADKKIADDDDATIPGEGNWSSGLAPRTAGEPRGPRKAGPSSSSVRTSLYPEYWSDATLASALKARRVFQGTLRVNKECWFEARVAIHNTGGRASAAAVEATGGDDMVSVLVSGRDAINRAMEGDTVVLELLPQKQWRQPSTRLVMHAPTAAVEEAEVAAAEAATALVSVHRPLTSPAPPTLPRGKHALSLLSRACRGHKAMLGTMLMH